MNPCCGCCLVCLLLLPILLILGALFGKPKHDDEEKVAITTFLMD